ncbi:MAG TPA: hypothetical protein VHC97_12355 [Thermoanaerobaculia bacterium]|jgi:hypothetical protein|nr:hypothetical protein [Thermoanaerobaculia bacterium]
MSRPLAACLAFSLLGAGAASAGTVYVPIPNPLSSTGSSHLVQVWISNTGTAQRPYSATLLEAESDGTKRPAKPTETSVPAGRTTVLTGLGAQGKVRLLEVDANPQMSIEARMISTPPNGQTSVSPVPVISSDNLFEAGTTAVLLGLLRDDVNGSNTSLGVVNLGQQGSQCDIRLFRADGSQIATTATLTFSPLSMRYFTDAFGLLRELRVADARIQVTCTQPFYAFGTVFNPANGQMIFVTPSASGASTLTVPGGGSSQGPGSSTGTVFSLPGTFHTATTSNPKRQISVPLQSDLSLKRLVLDMDFVPGPWNREKVPGNHAIVWLYREKFRGNTIANVNAFSPSKSTLKAAQNINLGPGATTQDESGVPWEQGKRYHLRYTYDAEHQTISVVLSSGGATIKTLSYPGTAPNGVLTVPAKGLTVEFGHYPGQEGPEVPSYGWSYADLRIEMVPY